MSNSFSGTLATMNPAILTQSKKETSSAVASPQKTRWPFVTLALTAGLFCFLPFPPVRDNPRLFWSFAGTGAALLAWQAILVFALRGREKPFEIQYTPSKSHYIQAVVQLPIFVYWGLYDPLVYAHAPHVLAQAFFLYTFEGLINWSRGRTWRLGFGPLPVIFSANLLLWFRDDWFYMQFLMLAMGATCKQFITWNRDGKKTHIFNPSAFGQSIFAVGLILTGKTIEYTWGKHIAQTFEAPHMLLVIFALGLVVQYIFEVTLLTLSAGVTLVAFNLLYTALTGTYFFANIYIAAPIFLAIHFLITDPPTSPKTNMGRVAFGVMYPLCYCVLFRTLELLQVPQFWDKILAVPLLNLSVPMLDSIARSGFIGRLNARWENALPSRKMNWIHMGVWSLVFIAMVGTNFVEGPHPGNSIPFWKKAYAENRPFAGESLVRAAGAQAEGGNSGAAYNELGIICMEGKIVNENHTAAAKYFEKACELGEINGCINVVSQFLFLREHHSDEQLAQALDRLESQCELGSSAIACYFMAAAYEKGRGRPLDRAHAVELYRRCGAENIYAAKGLARIALSDPKLTVDLQGVSNTLDQSLIAGDSESAWYLAFMNKQGLGTSQNSAKAKALIQKACELGSTDACEAAKNPSFPEFTKPIMSVPDWVSSFPN